jgi:hypothetical protein
MFHQEPRTGQDARVGGQELDAERKTELVRLHERGSRAGKEEGELIPSPSAIAAPYPGAPFLFNNF